MLHRLFRRFLLVAVMAGLIAAGVIVAVARPWQHDSADGDSGQVAVQQATLRTGEILLVLVNRSEETARVAQIILNDAFVDFRQSEHHLRPGDAERITIVYPWVGGESYDLQLMTATGATIGYEIEDAGPGTLPT
jgi:hypothetical protein